MTNVWGDSLGYFWSEHYTMGTYIKISHASPQVCDILSHYASLASL